MLHIVKPLQCLAHFLELLLDLKYSVVVPIVRVFVWLLLPIVGAPILTAIVLLLVFALRMQLLTTLQRPVLVLIWPIHLWHLTYVLVCLVPFL